MNIVLTGMQVVRGILLILLVARQLAVAWMFVVDYPSARMRSGRIIR